MNTADIMVKLNSRGLYEVLVFSQALGEFLPLPELYRTEEEAYVAGEAGLKKIANIK